MAITRPGPVLTTGQVAAIFRVDPKTVTHWADKGLLPVYCRTLGITGPGHRRYSAEAIAGVIEAGTMPRRDSARQIALDAIEADRLAAELNPPDWRAS
jgi:Helix-turn-helix domain